MQSYKGVLKTRFLYGTKQYSKKHPTTELGKEQQFKSLSQQWALAGKGSLGCTDLSTSRTRGEIIPLYLAVISLHLEYCEQFLRPKVKQ